MSRLNSMYDVIRRILRKKTRKGTQTEFYKMAVLVGLCGCEM
jgi:preprotein translocase subunit Sss1